MNLVQPEGQEEEKEDDGGGGDMEPPQPPPDSASSVAEAAEEPKEDVDSSSSSSTPSLQQQERQQQHLSPELQQGYRILSEFLLEKHRPLTGPFLRGSPDPGLSQSAAAPSLSSSQESNGHPSSPRDPSGMWLLKMEEKFTTGQYQGIKDFVADFRLMLESCYRLHGVDHWLSKQAQKLEMMLEQKLALLSRHLREKTAIAVTSTGFYGLEDEKGTAYTSTRRRSTPRSLAGLTTGVFESVMVQVLRQEEQLRAKEEKRLREQEKREAEEASQKEIEEWEKCLLAQAAPTRMENMWEIPAIGHFLCLAQHILNLPEIVFYELERCLLMPQCSAFLSKIMTSLLSPPHRRSTLHRRPTLPYRTWEAALKQKVQQWYTAVGQTDNPASCAEKLGLCPQFFEVLGEVNPLEEKPFHELLFCQKVWLLKGLCDFVYETQKDVQDAVLGQPIHECREVILGYDYLENAYVHFPQFCGADVRIYKQKPFHAPEFPVPPIKVKRVPRIKPEKVKYDYVTKNNGEISPKEEFPPHIKIETGKIQLDHLSVPLEEEMKYNTEANTDCNFNTDCYKENRNKAIVPGENVGFREPHSPSEINILENGGKCGESSVVKTETTRLKENTLKTCQMHVNGNQSDNPDMNCHKVARQVNSDHSLEHKTLKLSKMRAKKKKKKKKKLKDILNENLQRKREIHFHTLKSYKPEIQNKLFIMKNKAKHKKHKSGKKSISKKAISKKRKSVTKPLVPEFQLICTNLDELRELIRKIENELKDVENIKKKSGRWYHRKQAVKELHCTLIRLLNELLPWEPKLMKAFQRNRSRLKKDYDDFKKQPDHDKFTREQWTNEDSEISTGKDSSSVLTSESSEHADILKRDYTDSDDMRLSEMDIAAGKARSLKKESTCKEIQKTLPKLFKRQSKQNSYLDDNTKDFSPRKKLKLSASDTTDLAVETDLPINDCLNKLKQLESSESLDVCATSTSSLMKGTKPIQALLAKNIGNKVTLTSQLPPAVGRSISAPEKLISPMDSSPVKPVLPCQTSSKSPLQVLYKVPGGHCVPVDLHNNSVKIQMQPLADCKAGEKSPGEKIMQQVLILPKNFLIHHTESKSVSKEIQPLQQKTTEQHPISPSQPAVNTTLAPALSTSAVNAATTFLPRTKNATQLSQSANPINRLPTLPPITSAGNLLASVVKMSQNETPKAKTVVSAASFPVSSAVQTMTVTVPQSVSVCTNNSTPRLENPQKISELAEPKQELKTICIRDSQSILVTTRGGNTGIVKVQTNADKIPSSNLSPSSVFTYAPQLQAFLMPKSTQLPTSTFTAITTTMSNFPTLVQSSTTSASKPAVPASKNQAMGKNMTLTFGQHNSGTVSHGIQKTVQVSSPTFLSPMTSSSLVMPVPPNSSGKAVSISPGNTGQSTIGSTWTPFIDQQGDVNSTKYPTTQPETVATSNGNVMSSPQIPKLMLVTNPPLLPACGTPGVNLIPAPTSTGITAQKLVFINTPLANIQSNTSLTSESFKQTFPPSIGKTYVKGRQEQPQLVLIPSTVGNSIKVNASPTVSQIKDVKIGLNIGQAIINSKSNQSVSPINIMQSAVPKDTEEKNSQNVTLPLSTCSGLSPVCSSLVSQSIAPIKESRSVAATAVNRFAAVTTTTNSFLDSASVALKRTIAGTQPTIFADKTDTSTKVKPVLTTQLHASNVGNTVAISTVKTGHLASSVLISTTHPTVSHQGLSPTFQLPVTVALPGPMNGTPKIMQTGSQLPTVPVTTQCMPLPKGQQSTLVQFQSPGISAAVPANGNVKKPQMVLPPNASNAGKVVSLSNLVPLPCQSLPPNFVKPTPAFTCTSNASTSPTVPASTSVTSNVGGQLNESCIQQKIIINTCTSLAPGTQIMINGTRFIVPPQGLAAGSHVLLISSNPKLGPLLTVSNGHGIQRIPRASAASQRTAQASINALCWQPSKQPLKSSTKIVNSLGSANTLPIVHTTPEIVNSVTNPCTPATTVSTSLITAPPSSTPAKASLVSAAHIANSQLQGSASVLHLDTSIKKLMVSPEGAILNAINTPASKTSSLPSSFSPDMVSTTTNSAVVFPTFLKSSIGVPDTAAS